MSQSHGPVFNTFLVKLASRCNLDCDYCYMYHHADQSWRSRPRFMSAGTVHALAENAAKYAGARGLTHATVLIHGGEPLLAGPDRMRQLVGGMRSAFSSAAPHCRLEFSMQTNGVLLSRPWLDLFVELGITFGISLDGDRDANDRHRRYAAGGSSFDGVEAGLSAIAEHPKGSDLFRGFLAVMDLRNDPLVTYAALATRRPPRLDFLFPEGTHDSPPPGKSAPGHPYADWLIPIFDAWFSAPNGIRIRLFENLIDVILGGRSLTEGVGEGHLNLLTIETDGQIEDVDLFKAAFEGGGRLLTPNGRVPSVNTVSFEALGQLPSVLERHRLHTYDGLSEECKACPALRVCGGGFIPHRWSKERGFDNPSVYCADLYSLIAHVHGAVRSALRPLCEAGHAVEQVEGAP